ncbi:MAG: hypothetical protein AAGD00_08615 [Planctomycetota bacterium]
MRRVLASDEPIAYLDRTAHRTLTEARMFAREHRIAERRRIKKSERETLWITWWGTVEVMTCQALLESVGIDVSPVSGVALRCKCSERDLIEALKRWRDQEPDLLSAAAFVPEKAQRKYDAHLPDDLLDIGIASRLRWLRPEPDASDAG